MIDYKNKLDTFSTASVEELQEFDEFLKENLFDWMKDEIEVELSVAWTTKPFFNVQYQIYLPDAKNTLIITISITKSNSSERVFKDYLRSEFAVITKDFSYQITDTDYLGGEFESFKENFYDIALTRYLNQRN